MVSRGWKKAGMRSNYLTDVEFQSEEMKNL